jgi:hypothetical protein
MTGIETAGDAADQPLRMAGLAGVLLASLEALAAAGRVEQACRLGGQACAATRKTDPEAWRRFNALLHRLTIRPPRTTG